MENRKHIQQSINTIKNEIKTLRIKLKELEDSKPKKPRRPYNDIKHFTLEEKKAWKQEQFRNYYQEHKQELTLYRKNYYKKMRDALNELKKS